MSSADAPYFSASSSRDIVAAGRPVRSEISALRRSLRETSIVVCGFARPSASAPGNGTRLLPATAACVSAMNSSLPRRASHRLTGTSTHYTGFFSLCVSWFTYSLLFFAAGAIAVARHEDHVRRLLGHHIDGADDKNPEFIRLALLLHPEFSSRGSASGIARAQPHP